MNPKYKKYKKNARISLSMTLPLKGSPEPRELYERTIIVDGIVRQVVPEIDEEQNIRAIL